MLTKYTPKELDSESFSYLIDLAKEFEDIDFEKLGRESLGEQLNFLDAIPTIKEIHELLTEFPPEKILENTSVDENVLAQLPRRWLLSVSSILNLNVVHANPSQERAGILSEIAALKATVVTSLFGTIQYLRSLKPNQDKGGIERLEGVLTDFRNETNENLRSIESSEDERIKKRLESALKNFREETEEVMKNAERVRNARSEAENAAEAAQLAAAKTGFDTQSEFFKKAAEHSASAAFWWLVATLLSTLILVASIFSFDLAYQYFFGDTVSPNNNGLIDPLVRYLSTKVVTLSALAFLVILFRKNYTINRHNNVVNEHRANALKTFRALSEASQSEQSTDTILQAAAACIFSHQETGYAKSGNQEANIPQIVLNPTANPSM